MRRGVGWYIPKIYVYDGKLTDRIPIQIGSTNGNYCDEIKENVFGDTIHGRPLRIATQIIQLEFLRRYGDEKRWFRRYFKLKDMTRGVEQELVRWAKNNFPRQVGEDYYEE